MTNNSGKGRKMTGDENVISNHRDRRSFLKTGLAATGAAALGAGVLGRSTPAFAQAQVGSSSALTPGDTAILQFLAAGELLEADFWTQYNELGGFQDSEVPDGSGNRIYKERLREIDPHFPQYIHDNADDEISHATFINAYLVSRGAEAVSLEQFRTLQGSKAT
jgi:hypothetical protein